ncbi:NAD+ synthase [Desulforhabdus amnigena]|jgi:NAD+ synthetase|uniref:Glutamine-dependent NAD(+) synthetase n=1 Tax=Desulforhabdus amnigena TaxID=40218 RepID=A0A9W6FRU0_9BACT|nr:NAD+ synthase [Desulforhabdus amnigena]NLJ28341.1 NAD+ synthase [Deltaproteobacteria bacterium]GLI33378.1 NAD+ synthase [Desulforhabdus amnigena]
MRIALAQMNPYIGDFAGNAAKIRDFIEQSRRKQCDLVVFPELALLGYPPRDLLDKPSFVLASKPYWQEIQEASKGIGVIVGAVAENKDGPGKPYHNSALFFDDGALVACAHKRLLPSYDVFDEERYFEPGKKTTWVDYKGARLGLTICEDIWNVKEYLPRPLYHCDPICELQQASVEILINISASPYHVGKAVWVSELLKQHATQSNMQVVYVNQVGGNDQLVFHGHSMVWDQSGRQVACGYDFKEDLIVYDTETLRGDLHESNLDKASEVIEALILGLKDYASKCGFKKAVLGLSGGVDSALTACLAVMALGRENVMGVAMPGPYNAPESLEDARVLSKRLGISFHEVPIGRLFDSALQSLAPVFEGFPPDVTEENLQARIRGMILMAISNKFNRLLLSTGNKSEMAVGYCTLYGDMNGGLALLGDVPKTLVYELAYKLNEIHEWIPERSLVRAPSAELRPDQKDQDTLPPYDVLDGILAAYVEERLPAEEIFSRGWDEKLVRWVINRVDSNEYKRWQAPPIIRVTTKAFGMGRRNPIAHGYREGRMPSGR